MPDEFEIRIFEEMRDVLFAAGEEIIDANDIVAVLEQPVAKMGAKKSGAAGDEYAHAKTVKPSRPHFQQNP